MRTAVFLMAVLSSLLWACGGATSTKEVKTGIYEPETQAQFGQILDELGVKPYPGAEVTKFTHLTDATLAYKVPSEGNTNKAILDYYQEAFAKAFADKDEWKKFAETPQSIIYMKGFDLTLTFTITSKNAALEAAGDTDNKPKYLKFEITLGDGADSY